MDIASRTIDRHEPELPDYIQGELSQSKERLFTRLKNNFILRYCNVGQVKRWAKNYKKPSNDPYQKTITRELLNRAAEAMELATGNITPHNQAYLNNRGITDADVYRYGMVSTSELCKYLSDDDITNLSLRISDKFDVESRAINGVSIPYYYGKDLYGFCTRIIDNPSIKYSITIPQRFCFGLDISRRDYILIVEGVFDAIPLINAGLHCMALGDSQPNYWKMLQASKYDKIILLFDNDYSGKLGAAKAHVILDEMLDVPAERINILKFNDGIDPIAYVTNNAIDESLKYRVSLKSLAAHLTILGKDYES